MSQTKTEKNDERNYSLNISPNPKVNKLILRVSDFASEDSDTLDTHIEKLRLRSSLFTSNADIVIYEHW